VTEPDARSDAAFEEIYTKHYDFLISIAVRKFGVPAVDADALVQEVFLNYLRRERAVEDVHAWLLGAICHVSRYYWREHGAGEAVGMEELFEHAAPGSQGVRDDLPNHLTLHAMLDSLPPRYREILKLRYYDGYSIAEIAQKLGVKPVYAAKLVSKCLKKVEKTYQAAHGSRRDLEHVVKGFVDPYRKVG